MAGQLRIIDNLEGITTRLSDDEYRKISDLVVKTIKEANAREQSYAPEQLEVLLARMTPEMLRMKTEHGYLVLYEEDGQLYGLGCLVNHKDNGWRMSSVYVDSAKRGRGIGTMIVNELERKAKELGIQIRYAYPNLFPSTIRFYENRGFNVLPGNYEWGTDKVKIYGIVMERAHQN